MGGRYRFIRPFAGDAHGIPGWKCEWHKSIFRNEVGFAHSHTTSELFSGLKPTWFERHLGIGGRTDIGFAHVNRVEMYLVTPSRIYQAYNYKTGGYRAWRK